MRFAAGEGEVDAACDLREEEMAVTIEHVLADKRHQYGRFTRLLLGVAAGHIVALAVLAAILL